jgi:predicted ATP-dependent endonuclease of OLD family
MSHIVEFRIDGLAGRAEPFEYKMNRNLNVFFGMNGCGKTSLLKILHSAMSNNTSVLARVPFASASVKIFSLHYKQEFKRTISKSIKDRSAPTVEDESKIRIDERDAIQIAQHEREVLQWKTVPVHKEASTTRWQHQYLPTSRLLLGSLDLRAWYTLSGTERPIMSEEQIDVLFAESIKQLWIKYAATLMSSIQKAQDTGLASILKAVLSPKTSSSRQTPTGLDSHQAYERMKKFLARQGSPHLLSKEKEFTSRYEADATLRRVVLDIDKIESKIEEATAPRNALESLVTSLFTGGKSVYFTDQSIDIKTTSGANIGVASLSSGEKHLLMILVETLLASDNSIMIDEPEISMNVDWQKRLIKIMRTLSPEAQLIIATHSPEIMADIEDNNIIRIGS